MLARWIGKQVLGCAVVVIFTFTSSLIPRYAQASHINHSQLCWAVGSHDQTVYFAEAEDREDRSESFGAMIELFGISHTGIHCSVYARSAYVDERRRAFDVWMRLRLEIVNTTFLSDLDY